MGNQQPKIITHMSNLIYKVGDRLGNLTITDSKRVQYAYSKQRVYTLTCSCGAVISGSAGFIKTKKDKQALKCKRCLWKDTYDNRNPELNHQLVHNDYKHKAATRKIAFNLSLSEGYKFYTAACYFCGTPPSNKRKNKHSALYPYTFYSGIDRLDSSLGYEIGNCVSCCKRCNQAKNDMSVVEFLEMCNKVVQRSSLRGVGASAPKQKESLVN